MEGLDALLCNHSLEGGTLELVSSIANFKTYRCRICGGMLALATLSCPEEDRHGVMDAIERMASRMAGEDDKYAFIEEMFEKRMGESRK